MEESLHTKRRRMRTADELYSYCSSTASEASVLSTAVGHRRYNGDVGGGAIVKSGFGGGVTGMGAGAAIDARTRR